MIVTEEGECDDGVYVIVHELALELPDVNAHVALLNVPPAPPSLHVIVPLGALGVPRSVSVTVAVNVAVLARTVDEGLGNMLVLVARWPTVRDDVPELIACVESPE